MMFANTHIHIHIQIYICICIETIHELSFFVKECLLVFALLLLVCKNFMNVAIEQANVCVGLLKLGQVYCLW